MNCQLCGGPHPFDTSIVNEVWNAVIRTQGLPEFLCLSCIVVEFTKRGMGFRAHLFGEHLDGVVIEVKFDV